MGKEQFFFQVFQRRVIQVELPFERTIGHALTAAEQLYNLVKHGVKVHLPIPSAHAYWAVLVWGPIISELFGRLHREGQEVRCLWTARCYVLAETLCRIWFPHTRSFDHWC